MYTDVHIIQDSNAGFQIEQGEIIADFSGQNLQQHKLQSDAAASDGGNYNQDNRSGSISESIDEILEEGNYYIRVYRDEDVSIDYRLSIETEPLDLEGKYALTQAKQLESEANISDRYSHLLADRLGVLDSNDYYQFTLDRTSDIDLSLSGFNSDIDLHLLDASINAISSSMNSGSADESITETLETGSYHINVYSCTGSQSEYGLNFSAPPHTTSPLPTSNITSPPSEPSNENTVIVSTPVVPQSADNTVKHIQGTLGADTFTYQSGYNFNIFSGNGNYNYSVGARDILDLSGYASNAVGINLAQNNTTSGVVYDPGNGTRVFDAIVLGDGSQILFENIEVVKFADTTLNLSHIPNDPLFNQQWNLHMTGVHNAWRFTQGDNSVLMGIVDTGLGTDGNSNFHPDLRNTIVAGNNYLDEWEDFSHGTLVQGTIGAAVNNSQGIAGINWNSPIYTIDVVGGDSEDYNLVRAVETIINEAKAQGQSALINMSLVGGYSAQLEQIIANNQDNALFIIASGNSGDTNISSPANLAATYNKVIAVGSSWGATDWYGNSRTPGERIDYSSVGWWGSNYGNGLTLMAPSEFISTSATIDPSSSFHTHGYDDDSPFSGTSASTAMVSGIASLLWSINSNLTSEQIKSILSQTATDLGAPGYDTEYGHGLVNADAAVRRAMATSRGFA